MEDLDILNIQWELTKGSIWLFVKKDADSIFEIIKNVEKERKIDSWEILAIRELLDQNQDNFYSLFENSEFFNAYANLLRKLYMAYIPWYHHLLLFLRINLFLDNAYASAKTAIQREQNLYARLNKKRRESQKKEQEAIRNASLEKIKNLSIANKILSEMDHFYFDYGLVPSIHDVAEGINLEDMGTLRSLLKMNKFQYLSPLDKDKPWHSSILIYPNDHSWDLRKARLKKIAEEKLQKKEKLDRESQLRFQQTFGFYTERYKI